MLNRYNYPKFINVIFNVLAYNESQIIRDYRELEMLQSSRSSVENYANKLVDIMERKLIQDFQKFLPEFGFVYNDKIIYPSKKNNIYIVVNSFDGMENLYRSIPFFTLNIIIAKFNDIKTYDIKETYAATVFNPILDLFYWYAGGADNKSKQIFLGKEKIYPAKKTTKNTINLKCPSLELCYLASGKVDFIETKFNRYSDILAGKILAEIYGFKISAKDGNLSAFIN